jgi:hypothetical protein
VAFGSRFERCETVLEMGSENSIGADETLISFNRNMLVPFVEDITQESTCLLTNNGQSTLE